MKVLPADTGWKATRQLERNELTRKGLNEDSQVLEISQAWGKEQTRSESGEEQASYGNMSKALSRAKVNLRSLLGQSYS